MTIKEIANVLGRSINTISWHILRGNIPAEFIHRRGRFVAVDKAALPYFKALKRMGAHAPYRPAIFVYIPDTDGLGLMLPVDAVERYLKIRAVMRAAGRTKNHYLSLTRQYKLACNDYPILRDDYSL